jgi:mycothiol synthase
VRFQVRPPTKADIPALAALYAESAEEEHLVHTTTEATIAEAWKKDGFDPQLQVRVATLDGEVVGTGSIDEDEGRTWINGYTTPSARGLGIATSIFDWGLQEARRRGATRVSTNFVEHVVSAKGFITQLEGFVFERSFSRMQHPAPDGVADPVWPSGVRLMELPDDPAELLCSLRNETLVEHWGFTPWSVEETRKMLTEGDRDPRLCFVAADDSGPVALSMCGIKRPPQGYLGPIGTLSRARGRGIAKALLRHSMHALARAGASQVVLWVDSDGQFKAARFYQREGFKTILRSVIYTRELSD